MPVACRGAKSVHDIHLRLHAGLRLQHNYQALSLTIVMVKKAKVEPKSLFAEIYVGMPTLQDSCMYVAMYSLAKSDRLICIGRSWEFRFAMLTSVRAK